MVATNGNNVHNVSRQRVLDRRFPLRRFGVALRAIAHARVRAALHGVCSCISSQAPRSHAHV